MNATVKIESNPNGNKFLMITLPMEPTPTLSSTGKTLLVATTHGAQKTDLVVNGKPVSISINAFIKAN